MKKSDIHNRWANRDRNKTEDKPYGPCPTNMGHHLSQILAGGGGGPDPLPMYLCMGVFGK